MTIFMRIRDWATHGVAIAPKWIPNSRRGAPGNRDITSFAAYQVIGFYDLKRELIHLACASHLGINKSSQRMQMEEYAEAEPPEPSIYLPVEQDKQKGEL